LGEEIGVFMADDTELYIEQLDPRNIRISAIMRRVRRFLSYHAVALSSLFWKYSNIANEGPIGNILQPTPCSTSKY
jgi:hypothetical protein